jgi:hypothetical protein
MREELEVYVAKKFQAGLLAFSYSYTTLTQTTIYAIMPVRPLLAILHHQIN